MTEESQAPEEAQDADKRQPTDLAGWVRSLGSAAWLLGVLVLVALVLVAVALLRDGSSPDTSTIATVEAPVASTVPSPTTSPSTSVPATSESPATTAATSDPAELQAAVDEMLRCLAESNISVDLLLVSESRIELGTRDQSRVERLTSRLSESPCVASLQVAFPGVALIVVGPDDSDGGGSAVTLPETTDGSVVPTLPPTDTTLPNP